MTCDLCIEPLNLTPLILCGVALFLIIIYLIAVNLKIDALNSILDYDIVKVAKKIPYLLVLAAIINLHVSL